jgi:membrane protease YdiL (CAAX protease family)
VETTNQCRKDFVQPSHPFGLKPAPLSVAIPIFAGTSLLFFLALYVLLPALRNRGSSWFLIYNLVLVLPTLLLVCAALIAYRIEGRDFTWVSVRDRFRLRNLDSSGWFWTAALSAFMFGGHNSIYLAFALTLPAILIENRGMKRRIVRWAVYVALFLACSWLIWQTQRALHSIPLHSEPRELGNFFAQFASTSFMGLSLKGRWWIPVYYLLALLAGNIAGEELWWRGYLFPRQELAHGQHTWLVHGVLWAAFHLFLQMTAWDMVRMFPTCCALAFVAQHKKNTWPGIVGHTFGNSGFLLQIVRGVL